MSATLTSKPSISEVLELFKIGKAMPAGRQDNSGVSTGVAGMMEVGQVKTVLNISKRQK